MIHSKGVRVNKSNGQERRNRVLVTITPYTEQEKRVINSTTSGAPPPPPPLPLPLPSKTRNTEDSVEMQSIESFKLKDTPNPVIPKPPPTYFPVNNVTPANGSPRHAVIPNKPAQDASKTPASTGASVEVAKTGASPTTNGPLAAKVPLGGKIAVRIGAYEGEVKQPSRLDFLSQQARVVDKNGTDDIAAVPMVSRLQNELAATLQRSNLRRKTDGETQANVKSIPDATAGSTNETTNPEPGKLPQSRVETLANALNKVTIKVNTDNNSR